MDEILLRLFVPFDPNICHNFLELFTQLLVDGRVLRELIKDIVLDHEVFAEGSLLLRVIYHHLVIACREHSREYEEIKVINVVRREIWQVHRMHRGQLIKVPHVVDDELPAHEHGVDEHLIDDLLRVISQELQHSFFQCVHLPSVVGEVLALAQREQGKEWCAQHL